MLGILPFCAAVGTVLWLSYRSAGDYPGELKGIGGWLAFAAIGIIFAPMDALADIVAYAMRLDLISVARNPLLYAAEIPLKLAGPPLAIWVVWHLLRRTRRFKSAFAYLLLFWPLASLADLLWVSFIASVTTDSSFLKTLDRLWRPDVATGTLTSALSAVVWIDYLRRSKRVANTFVN
jgi:hypothetical protein